MAKASTQFQKIDWLLTNQHLWEGYGTYTTNAKRGAIKRAMVQEGLYAEVDNISDRILADLVHAARLERKQRYALALKD